MAVMDHAGAAFPEMVVRAVAVRYTAAAVAKVLAVLRAQAAQGDPPPAALSHTDGDRGHVVLGAALVLFPPAADAAWVTAILISPG